MNRVKEILERKGAAVVSIARTATLAEAAELLHEHNIGALLVTDGEESLVGVLSERDIVREIARSGAAFATLPVEAAMTADVRTCSPSDSVQDLMSGMTRFRMRHYPVLDDGKLVGIVSIGDLVKHRLSEMETEKNVLRDILVARQ